MTFFTLEFKQTDSKGREKNPKYVGVFKSLEDLEISKNKLLALKKNISFQIYQHNRLFK